MDSILSNDVFEMKVTSLTVTGIYYQFPPYLNTTGIIPTRSHMTVLLFWVWFWRSLSFWEAVASRTNLGKAEMSRGM